MSTPRYLQVEPTTRCNFTCGFCCGRHMEQRDMDFQRFVEVLDTFADLEHVELQGEGESLLHPRFLDMVAEARGRGIRVSFITNGSLLDAELVERLLDLGIEKISVSIESPYAEEFRAIRGGKLEKVVRNLRGLMAARRRRELDRPVVGLSITVLRRTRGRLHEILDLYRELRLDGGVTLQPLQNMPAYTAGYSAEMAAESLEPAEIEALWYAFFADPRLREVERTRGAARGFFDELMDGWKPAAGRCPWLEHGLYVGVDGGVTGCCMIKDVDRFGLGRVGRDAVSRLLEHREALRAELAQRRIPEPCRGCELAKFAVMRRTGLVGFGLRGLWARLSGGRPGDGSSGLVQVRAGKGGTDVNC